ncbi:MAG TPA: YggS family pyridoxal phosphate-dependent enzyme [Candidatus Dormibacteraeota bacterium]
MSVVENLASVRERIARAGRNPDEITIVAVTKGFGPEVCRAALDAGLEILGENRVHEGVSKMEAVQAGTWHLIGHLQTNKVRLAVEHFAMIQTVDSTRLAEAISRVDPGTAALVEVNVAREPQKSGADPDRALAVITSTAGLLAVKGLMAMGPSHGDPTPAFVELRRLRDEAEQRLGKELPVLSMGMSGDFESAVAAGSTMLRLGQALFGPRPARSILE